MLFRSAFGRLGTQMGSQMFGMQPDLITTAKGLTSAYAPLSAVIVGEKVWNVIDEASSRDGAMGHGWTYLGNQSRRMSVQTSSRTGCGNLVASRTHTWYCLGPKWPRIRTLT